MIWWITSCNRRGRKRRRVRSAKGQKRSQMKRKARSFRETIRYKLNRRQKHSHQKLRLRDRVNLQLRKVGEEVSLLEEMQQIGQLLPGLVKRSLQNLRKLDRVAEMPSSINQLFVSNKSKDQLQRLPAQMVTVKKKSLRLLQRSNLRQKWWPLQNNWKRTARNRSAYMPASSGLTMKSSGFWSWSYACKCWKTSSPLHLLHPLLLQRQLRLPVQGSTDLLKPQDLQTSNLWRYRQDIRDLVAMSCTELLPGWTQLIGDRPGHGFVLSPDFYVCRHSLDCASFECHLVREFKCLYLLLLKSTTLA